MADDNYTVFPEFGQQPHHNPLLASLMGFASQIPMAIPNQATLDLMRPPLRPLDTSPQFYPPSNYREQGR